MLFRAFHGQSLVAVGIGYFRYLNPVSRVQVGSDVVSLVLGVERIRFRIYDFARHAYFEGLTGLIAFHLAIYGVGGRLVRSISRSGRGILLNFAALVRGL